MCPRTHRSTTPTWTHDHVALDIINDFPVCHSGTGTRARVHNYIITKHTSTIASVVVVGIHRKTQICRIYAELLLFFCFFFEMAYGAAHCAKCIRSQ